MANENELRSTHVISENENNEQVEIADEVFVVVAALAATEVEGVDSMAGNVTKDLIAKLGKTTLSKGVKVDVNGTEVSVYVSLNIRFGYTIPDVAAKVQERIKTAIENMVGFTVNDVNIKIAGVVVD